MLAANRRWRALFFSRSSFSPLRWFPHPPDRGLSYRENEGKFLEGTGSWCWIEPSASLLLFFLSLSFSFLGEFAQQARTTILVTSSIDARGKESVHKTKSDGGLLLFFFFSPSSYPLLARQRGAVTEKMATPDMRSSRYR